MPLPPSPAVVDTGLPAWAERVLSFWFDEVGPARWFAKDTLLDAAIRDCFLGVHQALLQAADSSQPTARAQLAAIIVLDQFSRNMFRDSPLAFAADARALALARQAIARGDDRTLGRHERLFLYLPFEHSEDRGDQARAVELVRTLDDANLLGYAEAHQALVERFGRFPHRNAALGRASTLEELDFLQQHPQGF